jgi:hypothetical protein
MPGSRSACGGDHVGQQPVDGEIHVGEAQRAGGAAVGLARGAHRARQLRQRRAGVVEEHLSRLRQPHVARRTLEKRDADLLLEVLDQSAERGLHDMQPLGGAMEVQLLGDRDEGLQMADIDHPAIDSVRHQSIKG